MYSLLQNNKFYYSVVKFLKCDFFYLRISHFFTSEYTAIFLDTQLMLTRLVQLLFSNGGQDFSVETSTGYRGFHSEDFLRSKY